MDFGNWYDRRGRPMSFEQWGATFEQAMDYKRVCADDVITGDGQTVWVSTVWLGIDHGWYRQGPPVIFETMVFREGMSEEYCDRYSSEAAARDGHARAVRGLRSGSIGLLNQREE
jgi:hypothetical protein